jgi:hypothetical protein
MAAYLTTHPPVRDQWYTRRNRPLTGCTVLHTAEGVLDTIGPDTGAENTAEFIRRRTSPGSYHDLCDSDSALQLVEYVHGAYHDGTGSNNWALSISWALRTTDWRTMTPARRAAFLARGAQAFVRQQAYRRSIGAPLTELRRISKAQSDAGLSGFIGHGERDPGRRSDPGTIPPNLFPWDEWFRACREALGGQPAPTPDPLEDDMLMQLRRDSETGAMYLTHPAGRFYHLRSQAYVTLAVARQVCKLPAIPMRTNEVNWLRNEVIRPAIPATASGDVETFAEELTEEDVLAILDAEGIALITEEQLAGD